MPSKGTRAILYGAIDVTAPSFLLVYGRTPQEIRQGLPRVA
ncbi:hypothetical protein [Methylobacterium sp. 77]|nr:hypothetical protein [Methylobacterium sp. 77]